MVIENPLRGGLRGMISRALLNSEELEAYKLAYLGSGLTLMGTGIDKNEFGRRFNRIERAGQIRLVTLALNGVGIGVLGAKLLGIL